MLCSCELENGEKLGHIEVHLKSRPGISDHHIKLASKDRNLEDVMEALGIVKDNNIKDSLDEAAFNSRISNHEDDHEIDWPQIDSQESGGRLHRTTRKVKQWKVGLFSDIDDIIKANSQQNAHTEK
jgi:hypothetical protein